MATRSGRPRSIATLYLARGADQNSDDSFARFRDSYIRHRAGYAHDLVVLLKGFETEAHQQAARDLFADLKPRFIDLPDPGFDLMAYLNAARMLDHDRVMCLNTHSELLCDDWLTKLSANLDRAGVGVVGSTGSYESLSHYDPRFPVFPNSHLRSNAFLIDRKLLLEIAGDKVIANKDDAFMFESGPNGLTREVEKRGLEALIVGRNGRGYTAPLWPLSDTFRLGAQVNLLIGDNQTRDFHCLSYPFKSATSGRTWGEFLRSADRLRRAAPAFAD
jgi:hypothetical protein